VRFSHIIATKGRPDVLRGALENSLATLPHGSELIVVDGDPDCSAEPVVRELEALAVRGRGQGSSIEDGPTMRYLTCRPGLTIQRNRGIDAAGGEVLLFTDDDCTLEPEIFEGLAAAYADPSLVGASGRLIEGPSGRIGSDCDSRLRRLVLGGGRQGTMTAFGFRRPIVDTDREHELEFMPGSFMSARRDAARAVRFDERLTGYALGEDDDFSFRLSRMGKMRYLPTAVVHHRQVGRPGLVDSRAFNRNLVLSRAYLLQKNFGDGARARLGFAALIAMLCGHRILNREWRGLRGLLDGLVDVQRRGPGAGAWVAEAAQHDPRPGGREESETDGERAGAF
jgi:glucosyl-dolichyl phosphate glucuronosyltransferase